MFAVQTNNILPPEISLKQYTFERVDSFMYVGSEISKDNSIGIELRKRLIAVNKYYYGLLEYLRCSVLSTKTKVTLYKTQIRPVMLYASQT
jgi:hypothetical protein